MKKKELLGRISGTVAAFALAGSLFTANTVFAAAAEETENVQYIYTDYADLWTSTDITAEAGTIVKWYVVVPDDVTPRGCGATIKIPGLGFGTDTHNREEGHIVLQPGENFIYEFTPEEEGDILFTCWMGSGCHKNFIHVTPAPADESSSEAEDTSSVEDSSAADESSVADEDTSVADATSTIEDETSSAEDTSSAESSSLSDSTSSAAENSSSSAESSSLTAETPVTSSSADASSSKSDSSSKTDSKSSTATTSVKSTTTTAKDSNPNTGSAAGGVLTAVVLLGGAVYTVSRKVNK